MEIVISAIGSVLVILLGIVGFFMKKTLKDLELKIKSIESEQKSLNNRHNSEMDNLKMNYLDRFDKMKEHQSAVKEAILSAISELSVEIKGQKQFCLLMNKQRKER